MPNSPATAPVPLHEMIEFLESQSETDFLFYNGKINELGRRWLRALCAGLPHKRTRAALVLVTPGGDPNEGYRIGRFLQERYESLTVYVTGPCKSAGTLVAIAASELVFGDQGDLGPLDIQLSKTDELWEMSSGLNVLSALSTVEQQVYNQFAALVVTLKSQWNLTTKTAAQISSQLTVGIYKEISAQIDPLQLGEISRSLKISAKYGDRLNEKHHNLKVSERSREQEASLDRLISSYPSHGFVIDLKEAREIFNQVRPTSEFEELIFESVDKATLLMSMIKLRKPEEPSVMRLAELAEKFVTEPIVINLPTGDPHERPDSDEAGIGSPLGTTIEKLKSNTPSDSESDGARVTPHAKPAAADTKRPAPKH